MYMCLSTKGYFLNIYFYREFEFWHREDAFKETVKFSLRVVQLIITNLHLLVFLFLCEKLPLIFKATF